MDQTVYIVDDDESVRRALRRLVLAAGLKVQTFTTAEEFLCGPAHSATGCLVLDLHLPGLDGLQLQEQLALQNRSLPIVFITAHGDEHKREHALSAGASAFLEKPFEEKVLLGAIERAIARSE